MFAKVLVALCFACVALARPSPQAPSGDKVVVVPAAGAGSIIVAGGPTVDIGAAQGVPIIAVPVPVVVSSGAAQSSGAAVNVESQPAESVDTPATTEATTQAQTEAQTEATTTEEATTTTTTTTEAPVGSTGLIGFTSAPVIVVASFDDSNRQVGAWAKGQNYKVDELVTYDGQTYKVKQAHTAEADNWTPNQTPALWMKVANS